MNDGAGFIRRGKEGENRNPLKRPVILHASSLWGVHPIHFSASPSYISQSVACRIRHDHLMMKKHEAIAPDLSERIVIVGGGFAGVTLAQRLERLLPEQTEIIILGTDYRMDDR